jgi:hypothetical protein
MTARQVLEQARKFRDRMKRRTHATPSVSDAEELAIIVADLAAVVNAHDAFIHRLHSHEVREASYGDPYV